MDTTSIYYAFALLFACSGLILIYREKKRLTEDNALELLRGEDKASEELDIKSSKSSQNKRGLFSGRVLFLLLGITILIAITTKPALPKFFIALGIVLGGYVITLKTRARHKEAKRVKSIVFYLPIIMERLVMAVQAGLDIIPSIERIVDIANDSGEKLDPVTILLSEVMTLNDTGVRFGSALDEVSEDAGCSVLRHAFLHLGVAQQEGGEVIMPLKELSNSTQLYFQESVEEDIAKMPVKATLPLLLTFGGLIICFITSPLIQVMEITSKGAPLP